MAKIYSPPANIPEVPDFSDFKDENGRYDFNAHLEAESDWIELVQFEARLNSTGELVGEVISFGIADGYAQYVVWKQKPLQLIHLAVGDAWQIPEAHGRGINLTDVRAMVQRDKSMAEIFGKSKETFRTA